MSDEITRLAKIPICATCNNTGVCLSPETHVPVFIYCDSKNCTITKLRSDFAKLLDASRGMREALVRFSRIEADDGDNFEGVHEDVILRVEITARDLHIAREALASYDAVMKSITKGNEE